VLYLRVGMKLSDPDLLKTAEPLILLLAAQHVRQLVFTHKLGQRQPLIYITFTCKCRCSTIPASVQVYSSSTARGLAYRLSYSCMGTLAGWLAV
jgi:hypothetical protein